MARKYKFVTQLCNFPESPLWSFHIKVPDDISKFLIKTDRRVICRLNDQEQIHAALMPDGSGFYFINLNKEVRKNLGIELGDEIEVELRKDESEYGIFVPEVFSEMCYQDPEGSDLFHKLTKGKQRSLLHIMGKPKSEQKQLEKTLIIFDYLKSVSGMLDFKELMEAFRTNNRFR